jgi:hypothetical protein
MMLAGSWWLRVACRLCTCINLFMSCCSPKWKRRKSKRKKSRFPKVLLTCLLHLVSKSSGQPIYRHGPCKQENLPNLVLQYHFAALLLDVPEDVWLLPEGALAPDSQFGGHECCVLGNWSKLATMVYLSEVVVEVAVGGSSSPSCPRCLQCHAP